MGEFERLANIVVPVSVWECLMDSSLLPTSPLLLEMDFLKDLLIDSGLISICKIVNSSSYKGQNLYKGILFCC